MFSHIHTAPTLTRPLAYEEYRTFLWQLSDTFPAMHIQTIGTSAAGRSLYAVSAGEEGDLPTVVYAGADWLSAAVLFRFLTEYGTLLAENGRLYRVHLPYLFAHRRICVCPVLCPDAMEPAEGEGMVNRAGADIAAYFAPDCWDAPEKCPEASALRQYLLYGEPSLFCLLHAGDTEGVSIPPQPAPRAGTVGRLLSRMLTEPALPAACDPVLSIPAWYAGESGHPAYGISLGSDKEEDSFYRGYAAVRELLFSAPLLV